MLWLGAEYHFRLPGLPCRLVLYGLDLLTRYREDVFELYMQYSLLTTHSYISILEYILSSSNR